MARPKLAVGSRNVWKEWRGLGYNVEYRCKRNSTQVVLLEESCLIRCDNYNGIPSLIKRVLDQCVSSIEIPLAWELVFEFINALRCKHPPERACLEHLQIPVIGENAGTEWSDSFIAKEELSNIWRSVAERAKELWRSQNSKDRLNRFLKAKKSATDGTSGIGNKAAVHNSDNALDSALRIK